MTRLLLIGLAVLGFLIWEKHQADQRARQVREYKNLAASAEDSCSKKNFCSVIYVAPWCPACHSMEGQFKAFLEKSMASKDYGVRVVVGQEKKPNHNQETAARYGPSAVIDYDKSISQKLGVNHYPSIFVLDAGGTVILRDQEALGWMAEKFASQ